MKYIHITHVLFVCIFLLIACGAKKNQDKENNNTTNNKEEKEQKDSKNQKSDLKLKTEKREFKGNDYNITYEVIIEGSEMLKNKVHNTLLKALVYDDKDCKSLEDLEKKLKSKEYKVSSEDCQNASREFNASISQVKDVVALSMSDYSFECGAHGIGSITTHSFHIQSGKEITLKDIVKDEKRFTNQVEKQFCADNKLEKNINAYVNAGYDGFAQGFFLAKNYLFEKDGIRFIYNPYEADPYTLPPFDVKVTYEKIKPYLLENNPLGI